jgi:hypothetical protein
MVSGSKSMDLPALKSFQKELGALVARFANCPVAKENSMWAQGIDDFEVRGFVF